MTAQPLDVSDISVTGDEVDELIAANGGLGEFESAALNPTQRWEFPRYPGAEDPGDFYLSRGGVGGHDSDVETVVAWLEAPRNRVGGVMLLGEPGGGKTSLAQAACTHMEAEYMMITATPDHTKDSLLTRFVGEGLGEEVIDHNTGLVVGRSAFVKAALADAAVRGVKIIIDEYLLFVDGVKPITYPLLDGSHWLAEANADGSPAAIHPDTRVIVTANPLVRGASLPEPIASRFAGSTLHIETSSALLRDMGVDDAVVSAWEALGTAGLWQPQIREVRAADYWLSIDPTLAASCFLPEHCPDSMREAVTATVVGFLGGDLRRDGRLVVA